jgi:hypothetical protein
MLQSGNCVEIPASAGFVPFTFQVFGVETGKICRIAQVLPIGWVQNKNVAQRI